MADLVSSAFFETPSSSIILTLRNRTVRQEICSTSEISRRARPFYFRRGVHLGFCAVRPGLATFVRD